MVLVSSSFFQMSDRRARASNGVHYDYNYKLSICSGYTMTSIIRTLLLLWHSWRLRLGVAGAGGGLRPAGLGLAVTRSDPLRMRPLHGNRQSVQRRPVSESCFNPPPHCSIQALPCCGSGLCCSSGLSGDPSGGPSRRCHGRARAARRGQRRMSDISRQVTVSGCSSHMLDIAYCSSQYHQRVDANGVAASIEESMLEASGSNPRVILVFAYCFDPVYTSIYGYIL